MAVEHERAVARTERGGALATDAPSNPWATAGLLKPYAGGLVTEAPKVDALATITAGFKNDKGYPEASRDGTIYYRDADRAPGLIAELERRGGKSLTISLVHNDPKDVLQQWFASYSQTRLEAHGDEHQVTIIRLKDSGKKNRKNEPILVPEREVIRRDENPTRYAQIVATMKVQTSLYFALAEWTEDGKPKLIFPDGLGLYRLHFTSLHSAEAIRGQLSYIASLTGGCVAGVPLELSIAYRNLAGPDGVRRTRVPIWSLVLNPPETIALTAGRVSEVLELGISQARQLAIAAPAPETLELAAYEGPDVDLDAATVIEGHAREIGQHDADRLAGGGPIANKERARTEFFLAVGRTSLRDQESRAAFISAFTHGRIDSLATLIETISVKEWARFMEAVDDWVRQEMSERDPDAPPAARTDAPARPARSYEQLFGDDDDAAPALTPPASTSRKAPTHSMQEVQAAAILTGAQPKAARQPEVASDPAPEPTAASSPLVLPEEPDWLTDDRKLTLASWQSWAEVLRRLDSSYEIPDPTRLSTPRLVEVLQGIVGYTRQTYDSVYGDRGDDEPDNGLDDAVVDGSTDPADADEDSVDDLEQAAF